MPLTPPTVTYTTRTGNGPLTGAQANAVLTAAICDLCGDKVDNTTKHTAWHVWVSNSVSVKEGEVLPFVSP